MVFSSKTFKNRVRKSRKTVRKGRKVRKAKQHGGNMYRGNPPGGTNAGPMPWLDPPEFP
jgi:hypothetical protein